MNQDIGGLVSVASISQSKAIDTNSPYYLHHSDHPGLIFVTHPLSENGENYFTWRKNMWNAFASKNKSGFVDGTISKPDVDSPDFQPWVQCNAVVLSWLTNSLDKELQSGVAYADTANEVWVDLEERFTQGLAPRVYELKRAIALLQQEKAPISSYYGRLKAVWGELQVLHPVPTCSCGCTCGAAKKMQSMREEEKVYDFLMGLDDTFATVRSQVLSVDPLPSLGRAYAITAQEEKQKLVTAARVPVMEAATLLVKGNGGTGRRSNNGQQADSGRQGERVRCTHCNKLGHNREECFELNGYPSHWRKRPTGSAAGKNRIDSKIRDSGTGSSTLMNQTFAGAVDGVSSNSPIPGLTGKQHQQLIALLGGIETAAAPSANMVNNFSGKENKSWVIDTGATDHISCEINKLSNVILDPKIPPVQIPNGATINVHALGQVSLSKRLILENVLGVPDFCFNLLSVSKLTRDLNCALIFWSDLCVIQDLHSMTPIGVGRMRNGLYYLEPRGEGKALVANHSKSSDLWHRRLGHLPMNRLSFVPNLSFSVDGNNILCDACCKARQTRLPFPIHMNKSLHVFDLIHCDIWGPYRSKSLSGAHYFLTLVDDYSRVTWVFLMKFKSETRDYLLYFFQWVQTQFNSKVKVLRTDNGLEFNHHDLVSHYNAHGMERQSSCTDTPQQNGVVERKHRHLLEVARALRFQAHLPIQFWGECVLTATYLINRMPLTVLGNKTPYEVLFNKVPSYDHLRSFGCLCYGHVHNRLVISSHRVLDQAFLLGILMVKKGTKSLILKAGQPMCPVMFDSLRMCFLLPIEQQANSMTQSQPPGLFIMHQHHILIHLGLYIASTYHKISMPMRHTLGLLMIPLLGLLDTNQMLGRYQQLGQAKQRIH